MSCLKVFPSSATQFGVYEIALDQLNQIHNSVFNAFFAGSIGGVCAGALVHPIVFLRIRIATHKYDGLSYYQIIK